MGEKTIGGNLGLATRVGLHGGLQSFMSKAQGGSWSSGFWSGSLGTLFGQYTQTKSYEFNVAANAAAGGVISQVTGGKFANGAIMAAYRYMFNEALHKQKAWLLDEPLNPLTEKKVYSWEQQQKEQQEFLDALRGRLEVDQQERWNGSLLKQWGPHEPTAFEYMAHVYGDEVGLGLSVGATVMPGGYGYAMGSVAIMIDIEQGDWLGAFIGSVSMHIKPLAVFDIGYGINQLSN